MIGSLMAAANFLIAAGLIIQCLIALNRVDDGWTRFAIHLVIATAGGLLAFRGADMAVDIALSDRTAIGRFLLNLSMIPAWILIHRASHKRG
ncbi:hypothetical protein R5R73_04840 [Salinicola sp. LHM]|uniref:hypothetical protein n=1 Tax=Salinicola sp. LHM TaxID=3065298 RepID=UPI002ACE2FEB|nr:hypothetical protein [Salinicola sp. LHM]WQH34016.1 hypothetical protein R5R73_04840 [Salinicola sp. LHM]